MQLENLIGKKIAIVGMGVNNQKLAEYFTKHDIKFTIIENWQKNSSLAGRLDEFNIIFRTPGLPYLSPAIQQAHKKGVEISSQTKLFFDLCPANIIGVTGTKGKGTTSTLIAKILETGDYKVWLGGNIGVDPFEFLDFIHPDDLVVLELSSFQLQDLHKSPHVAVVLNITADHLDETGTYEKSAHASVQEYFDSKLQIIIHQTEKDFAVLSHSLPEQVRTIGRGQKIIFEPKQVSDYENQLIGKHFLENISAAAAVGYIYEIPEDKIRKAVREFKGLPHRMQKIGEKDGIIYINDSLGTNEDTSIAAIKAISKPLILILGGSNKGLAYQKLGEVVRSRPNIKAVVVVGEETPKILRELQGFEGKILQGAKNMAEIIAQARSLAVAGDTVLLSPAAASFDMFKSYADRGDQFAREAMK
jgi:UDP-N-acetylmuramoylalanine--D-glutamate ligase